jgi:DNA invertase Pin-like site-specific DNA recombinase
MDALCCRVSGDRQTRENQSEAIRAGQAREAGKKIGRPRVVVRGDKVVKLREQGVSWREIARGMGVGVGTIRRAHESALAEREMCHKCVAYVPRDCP